MIGVDGLAMCGDEADMSFFDEYNFEGLMNEPWYERIDGNEMRSLFKTKKQHVFRKRSGTPENSLKVISSDEGASSNEGSLSELDQSILCSKRRK